MQTTATVADPIRQALISVSNKEGLISFAFGLAQLGVQILSTGGTARQIGEAGVSVEEVSSYTKFPEMMDGRVKTLHPFIFGGLLGRRGIDDEVMKKHGIRHIGLVAVNFYPFEKTIAKPGCTIAEAIENIDIGGPAIVRATAKNYTDAAVVYDPADYSVVLAEMCQNGGAISVATRFVLMKKVFALTSAYDAAVRAYLEGIGTVHGLRSGFSCCDFSRYFIGCDFSQRMLKDWPEGHTGVRYDCLRDITCPDCAEEAIEIVKQENVA
ncbi:MAG: IMP cyclohydrolase [bacterium]|nr:IMP cyclohydrolase [bacterium]